MPGEHVQLAHALINAAIKELQVVKRSRGRGPSAAAKRAERLDNAITTLRDAQRELRQSQRR